MNELMQKYQALSDRDQLLVKLLGLVVPLFLVYLLLYFPAQNSATKAEERLDKAKTDYYWLTEHAGAAKTRLMTQNTQSQAVRKDIWSDVNSALQANGLRLDRYDQIGDDGLRITLDSAQFDAFAKALGQLASQKQIVVRSLSVNEAPGPEGLVVIRGELFYQGVAE